MAHTDTDKQLIAELKNELNGLLGEAYSEEDRRLVEEYQQKAVDEGWDVENIFGLNQIVLSYQTAVTAAKEIGLKRDAI